MSVIQIQNLTKYYGKHLALDSVDLEVKQGEVFGFIGPNGAGKTTTLRILLGLLRKNAGKVSLLGGDPWRDAVALHRRLAYVPGDVNLWPYLSGGEVIDLLARLRGSFDQSRRDELVERFKLDPTRQCRTYSKGNQQKVALIAALVSDVELLILDEPTLGLDPLMEAIFRECVAEVKRAGTTVLLSSHILAEVEALCDRISIINEGKIVETGTLAELRHLTRTDGIDPDPSARHRAREATGRAQPHRRRHQRPVQRGCRRDQPRYAVFNPIRRAGTHERPSDARGSVPALLQAPGR